jgi:hypothetical protein
LFIIRYIEVIVNTNIIIIIIMKLRPSPAENGRGELLVKNASIG